MTGRQKIICSHLPKVKTLADVGCDHGYMAQYALENGLCEKAYLTDISRESLKKAEKLLQKQAQQGKCEFFCCDGLRSLPFMPDCALIAGMGGEEIIKILSVRELPSHFVLQPMKNAEKVRAFLLGRGALITADYTFEDGKWYDLIVGKKEGASAYTEREIAFGRDNLSNPSPAFLAKIGKELREIMLRMNEGRLSEKSYAEMNERRMILEEIRSEAEKLL